MALQRVEGRTRCGTHQTDELGPDRRWITQWMMGGSAPVSVPLMRPGTLGAPGEHQVPSSAIGGRGRPWARVGVSSMPSATGIPLAQGPAVVVGGAPVAVPVTLCRRGHAIVNRPAKRMLEALVRSTHPSMCKVAPFLPLMVASKT